MVLFKLFFHKQDTQQETKKYHSVHDQDLPSFATSMMEGLQNMLFIGGTQFQYYL